MMRKWVLVAFVLAEVSCSRVPVRDDIVTSIDEQIAAGQSEIKLASIANFEWNEVCFLGPFMRPADISKVLGFTWHGKRTRSSGSAVFVKVAQERADSQATGMFHLPTPGDIRDGYLFDARGCLQRDHAVFAVRRTPTGPISLVPVFR